MGEKKLEDMKTKDEVVNAICECIDYLPEEKKKAIVEGLIWQMIR